MKFIAWWLRRIAGDDLARDIIGDVAESGSGAFRLAAIAAGLTTRRVLEFIGARRGRRRGLDGAFGDLRYSVRSLRRAPWYAATTIGVIALSMALATTVFAVVDGVLFKPLPYPNAKHVFVLSGAFNEHPGLAEAVSWSDLHAWRNAVPEAAFAFGAVGGRVAADDGAPVRSATVSQNFFDVIGQQPLLGGFRQEHFRKYTRTDFQPVLISYRIWQSRYRGDPSVIGRLIHGETDNRTQIVGVLPPGFLFPIDDGRFVPEALAPEAEIANPVTSRSGSLRVWARTPEAMTAREFRERAQAATLRLQATLPKRPAERTGPFDFAMVRQADIALGGPVTRPMFLVAFASAVALMLLACLNIAGLSATRIHDRHHELALRRALGGGRWDVVRLLASESFLVIAIGGALGLTSAVWFVKMAGSVLPKSIVLLKPLTLDVRVAAFALLSAAACVALTTIWPARAAVTGNLRASMSVAGGGVVRRSRSLGRFAMISTQVAVGLVMAIAGTLVAASLVRVWQQDTGYDPFNTMYLNLRWRSPTDVAFNIQVLDALSAVPGVTVAGAANSWFMERVYDGSSFTAPPGSLPAPGIGVDDVGILPGFLEAAGSKPIEGRLPTKSELTSRTPVIVISEIVAKCYFPGRSPIGERLLRNDLPFTIIGVVPSVRTLALDLEPSGLIYYPMTLSDDPMMTTVFVRFDESTRPNLQPLLAVMSSPQFSAYAVRSAMTMKSLIGESVRPRKFQSLIFAAFGIAAVTIVGVGVLGVVAMVTSRRTREVGVRMALGASPSGIVGLIVRQELAAVVTGLAMGALVSWWTASLLKNYMYKMTVHEPFAWAIAATVLLAVAMTGAIIPALRASRVDPVKALRVE